MKLLRLKADGFGPLRGEFPFDPDRATIVIDRNEAGKSSLLSAFAAALYGLDADRRTHRVITPLDRWRPWDGGSYRLELEVECDGERYLIRRDFDRGTVEVWNGRGQEVTAEFREGKEDFPVGRKLLGLDAAEFEKCALVRQNELELVVPGDEKARRSSTLNARLESAADTRGGDTNAAEAIQVLQGALRKYACHEIGFEGTIDVAIQRLEAKRELLASELRTLEHDLAQVAGPIEELTQLDAEEQGARAAIAALDLERRAGLGSDFRRRLEADDRHRADLERLRAEAESFAAVAHLPANADAELRVTIARHDEAQKNLEALVTRRRAELEKERGQLASERATLTAYESCGPGDADRCVSLAADMRRIADEDRRLRGEVSNVRDSLAARGHAPDRADVLTERFERLGLEAQAVLRSQPDRSLAFQTEVATLEQERTTNSERLREIDAKRGALRLPGWFLVALGLGTTVAGAVVLALHGEAVVLSALFLTAALLAAGGGTLLALGARTGSVTREESMRGLSEANRRLQQIRAERAGVDQTLEAMARSIGCRDAGELMRDWNEYLRLLDDSAPVQRAKEQLVAHEERRHDVFEEARQLLEKVGGGSLDPSHLERVAAGIRHLAAVRQRMDELESSGSWVDEERRVVEATASGLRERAVRILQSAGLAYDPARAWPDHVQDLTERLKGRSRYTLLVEELIPQAESRLLPEREVADLRRQLGLLDDDARDAGVEPGRLPADPRSPIEIEKEIQRHRDLLDRMARRRSDIRLRVEETCRLHAQKHPEKTLEKEAIERALVRARRFRQAIERAIAGIQGVALDTHRRWADHLNRRVGQILEAMGWNVGPLRFGDDLDFSIQPAGGQPMARGKAAIQLSAGARDQLYFAVRLAISEYLSRPGNPLPLLIDDVFATSDDERARAGMRMLIEHVAGRHQVIVMTCHRHRHDLLAKLDPELYAGQVQWLDATAASLTG